MKFLSVLLFSIIAAGCGKPTPAEVYVTVKDSVARVWLPEMNGGGSGFVVKAKSGRLYIATNAHVCGTEGATLIVEIADTGVKYVETAVFVSVEQDLCLITLTDQRYEPLKIGKAPLRGEAVYTVGHPFLNGLTIFSGHVVDHTSVEVAYDDEGCEGGHFERTFFGPVCVREMLAMNVTAQSNPGNSGGPLLNADGEVVGIVFAGGRAGNFALYPERLKEILRGF